MPLDLRVSPGSRRVNHSHGTDSAGVRCEPLHPSQTFFRAFTPRRFHGCVFHDVCEGVSGAECLCKETPGEVVQW